MSDIRRRRRSGESKTKFREDCIEEDEDDDDGSDSDHRQHTDTDSQNNKNRRKKKGENGEKNNGEVLRRAKNLLVSPFRRLEHIYSARKEKKKRKRKKNKGRNPPPFPAYPEAIIGKGCHLCFLQPRSVDSPPLPASNSKPTARGNSSSYHDFLRSLLEKNDFYSPDCNVHQDIC